MVDTPKEDDDEEAADANKTSKTQSKRRRPKRRPKPRRPKDGNTGTGENSTPGDAENSEDPARATSEPEHDSRQENTDGHAIEDDPEDDSYRPPSEQETSLGNEYFIVPEDPLEQERFKLQLIAIARSLKKKQQQLQVEQDTLNAR